jgi:hypothetical protein
VISRSLMTPCLRPARVDPSIAGARWQMGSGSATTRKVHSAAVDDQRGGRCPFRSWCRFAGDAEGLRRMAKGLPRRTLAIPSWNHCEVQTGVLKAHAHLQWNSTRGSGGLPRPRMSMSSRHRKRGGPIPVVVPRATDPSSTLCGISCGRRHRRRRCVDAAAALAYSMTASLAERGTELVPEPQRASGLAGAQTIGHFPRTLIRRPTVDHLAMR